MKVFDHIAIIYNPKSTGDASKIAKDLADSVNGHFEVIQKKATLYPTKKAGDAIELAYDIASKHRQPLIVSVSGDGGYNEVINGVMAAKKLFPAQKPVVAVVGAGNANDHERVVRDGTPMHIHTLDLVSHPRLAMSSTHTASRAGMNSGSPSKPSRTSSLFLLNETARRRYMTAWCLPILTIWPNL